MKRAILSAAVLALVSAHPASASSDSVEAVSEPEATVDPRVDCIIWAESRGDPNATNPRSGAAGLGQFLRSTWITTPQGQQGYSVYNAAANRAAVAWMLRVGRAREFVAVSGGWCW